MWVGNFYAAAANLKASKWRSFLTMLGIIIGISSVVTIVGLGEGLRHHLVGRVNSLGSNVLTVRPGKLIGGTKARPSLNLLALLNASTLTSADVSKLNKVSSVSQVVPMDFVTNSVNNGKAGMDNVYVVGTGADLPGLMEQKLDFGGFFSANDTDQNVAVIGPDVAHKLFGENNPVGEPFNIRGHSFIVHGVLSQSSGGLFSIAQTDFNSAVFIPFGSAQSIANQHTNILQILLRVKDGYSVNDTISQITKVLSKAHGQQDFSVLKQNQLLGLVGNVVSTSTNFISAIAAISLLVGGIGIMDMMLVSVSERTREVGIRKAVGATNRQILNQFLTEGLVLTATGGLLGILASLIINTGLRVYTNWQPVINWPIVALAVLVSIGVGLVFSAIPAIKAARKSPIDALRHD